ncbi:hypothetical protein EWB00_009621 [Schistosoma japonicum]|uniref:Uncharacterized protein n=1 Tax=Schistosoma japonicum TaxID=6182 RepID=A0A4Z2CLQ6_SCHJA|nr:hypothetical protein EWB00_009621 [Schistosoma japonicum]
MLPCGNERLLIAPPRFIPTLHFYLVLLAFHQICHGSSVFVFARTQPLSMLSDNPATPTKLQATANECVSSALSRLLTCLAPTLEPPATPPPCHRVPESAAKPRAQRPHLTPHRQRRARARQQTPTLRERETPLVSTRRTRHVLRESRAVAL